MSVVPMRIMLFSVALRRRKHQPMTRDMTRRDVGSDLTTVCDSVGTGYIISHKRDIFDRKYTPKGVEAIFSCSQSMYRPTELSRLSDHKARTTCSARR